MKKKNLRVIIIGGDHHNTLAMVRCFGKKKIDLKILVHTTKTKMKDIHLSSCRYVKNQIELIPEFPESMIDALNRNIIPGEKQVVFPCSDFSEYVLDSYATELENNYIIPGFQNHPGKVAYMMDKMHQKLFADEYNIPMAKTWSLSKCDNSFLIPADMTYPCILKPEISANGSKSDIKICNSELELTESLKILCVKGYETILVQQFLRKLYEVCAFGAMFNIKPYFSGGITKKLNEYPPQGGGSLTFAKFINDSKIEIAVDNVRNILFKIGYRGMYDIEFLICEDEIYLNEINFRHSGNGYALINNGIFSPYFYYLSVTGQELPYNNKFNMEKESYHMDELLELQLLKSGSIGLIDFIEDVFKAKAYAKFDLYDLKGSFAYYLWIFKYMKNKLLRRND